MAEVKPKQETRRIVRILSTDIPGEVSTVRALRRVKGVSFMFANAACLSTGLDKRKPVGQLSEADVKSLERFIQKPALPSWMVNRRKDPETGDNLHLSMADLDLKRREDINQMKRIRSYKGIRHELGQPVRGQRTRSTFRTKGRAVGVSKKKAMPAKAAPSGGDKKK